MDFCHPSNPSSSARFESADLASNGRHFQNYENVKIKGRDTVQPCLIKLYLVHVRFECQ
jgi:hypothetical protein